MMEGHLCTQFNSKYVYLLLYTGATILNYSFIYAAEKIRSIIIFLSAPCNVQFEKSVLTTIILQ